MIELRPEMYLGEKSITLLRVYLDGFFAALQIGKADFDCKNFQSVNELLYLSSFQKWAAKRFLNEEQTAIGWNSIILNETDNDEEMALNLFFALLEEFKLEKENLSNE